MDFFEHQERARRNTTLLVVLMVVAVGGILLASYAAVAGFVIASDDPPEVARAVGSTPWWQPGVFAGVSAVLLSIVGSGSVIKSLQLSGGGEAVAGMLGGRLLPSDTSDPLERKLLNVVEEMAIASGSPVPPVYLLDHESGINAFAAGTRLDNAVIGVTRGTAEQLSRDELQGVIAHEFSHILHGDMRLNVRLIAIVHGILVLGLLGCWLVRVAAASNRSSRDSKSVALPLVLTLIGLSMMVIGFIGSFIGSLIKAAVSRQREFLADASAVQYTRNPDGIAGALAHIASASGGSKVEAPAAAEVSHMFFAAGLWTLFSTHPPIAERIKRIDASREIMAATTAAAGLAAGGRAAGFAGGQPAAAKAAPRAPQDDPASPPTPAAAEAAVAAIGEVTAEGIAQAHGLIERIPPPLLAAAHEPFGCRAVIYALMLDKDAGVRESQLKHLAGHADAAVHSATLRLVPQIAHLPRACRLPLVDVAVGTLKSLSPEQYRSFRGNLRMLVEADRRIELFEWVLQKVVTRHLDPRFGVTPTRGRRRRAKPADVAVLLSALAYTGSRDPQQAKAAFAHGAARTGLAKISLLPIEQCRLNGLDKAVEALAGIKPKSKRRLVEAVAETVAADGEVTSREIELLRAVADTLDCPMPPIAAGPIA